MTDEQKLALGARLEAILMNLAEPVVEELAKILTGEKVISVIASPTKHKGMRYDLVLTETDKPNVRTAEQQLQDRVKAAAMAVRENQGLKIAQDLITKHAGFGCKLNDLMVMSDKVRLEFLAEAATVATQPGAWKLTPEELDAL